MKLPIKVKIPVPGLTLQGLYGKTEISVVVMLQIQEWMLSLFCPGSFHNIDIEFQGGQDLSGRGCTTTLCIEVEHPFTSWCCGDLSEYRLLARESNPANLGESEFKAFVYAMLVSSNVYVMLYSAGMNNSEREENDKKEWFMKPS